MNILGYYVEMNGFDIEDNLTPLTFANTPFLCNNSDRHTIDFIVNFGDNYCVGK